jgi:hypothetical protein
MAYLSLPVEVSQSNLSHGTGYTECTTFQKWRDQAQHHPLEGIGNTPGGAGEAGLPPVVSFAHVSPVDATRPGPRDQDRSARLCRYPTRRPSRQGTRPYGNRSEVGRARLPGLLPVKSVRLRAGSDVVPD